MLAGLSPEQTVPAQFARGAQKTVRRFESAPPGKLERNGEAMNILLDTIGKLPEMAELKRAIAENRLPCSLSRVAAGAKQHLARSISGCVFCVRLGI